MAAVDPKSRGGAGVSAQNIPATELAMRAFDDPERYTDTVAAAKRDGDGWDITMSSGWSIYATPLIEGHEPQPGETVTMWGRGIGHVIRGVAIGEIVYRYESDEEWTERTARGQAERDTKSKADYERTKPEYDRRIEALPEPFRHRIEWFRRNPDWGWRFEAYELFACEQAVVFATTFPADDALTAFYNLSYDEQRAVCPGMSDQHSGNTFGAAFNLARLYLATPGKVPTQHGALCPLVGCDEYGCWAATRAEASS